MGKGKLGPGCDGECELLVPWLEDDVLRERAEESSCESDCDCESDLDMKIHQHKKWFLMSRFMTYLEWSDSVEAACLKKGRLPLPAA